VVGERDRAQAAVGLEDRVGPQVEVLADRELCASARRPDDLRVLVAVAGLLESLDEGPADALAGERGGAEVLVDDDGLEGPRRAERRRADLDGDPEPAGGVVRPVDRLAGGLKVVGRCQMRVAGLE
jgi:hypothetical protein